MTENKTTNKRLGDRLIEVGRLLAHFDHLPALDDVCVDRSNKVRMYLPEWYTPEKAGPQLCAWADHFGLDVTISLSWSGSGELLFEFQFGEEFTGVMKVSLHSGQAYQLGAALQRPISPQEPTITVSPDELLAATGWQRDVTAHPQEA